MFHAMAGYLNIDCGATEKSVDPVTGFTWVPDAPYISTGKIQTPLVPRVLQNFSELKTLRYFDDLRAKNCYTLPVIARSVYLLTVTFFYGNYDNTNRPPSFQLAVDATILDNVTIATGDGVYSEFQYVSQGNVTYLCVIRTSPQSTPFISGISLKPATAVSSGYADEFSQLLQQGIILKTLTRVNFGGTTLIRYAVYSQSVNSTYLLILTCFGSFSLIFALCLHKLKNDHFHEIWQEFRNFR